MSPSKIKVCNSIRSGSKTQNETCKGNLNHDFSDCTVVIDNSMCFPAKKRSGEIIQGVHVKHVIGTMFLRKVLNFIGRKVQHVLNTQLCVVSV